MTHPHSGIQQERLSPRNVHFIVTFRILPFLALDMLTYLTKRSGHSERCHAMMKKTHTSQFSKSSKACDLFHPSLSSSRSAYREVLTNKTPTNDLEILVTACQRIHHRVRQNEAIFAQTSKSDIYQFARSLLKCLITGQNSSLKISGKGEGRVTGNLNSRNPSEYNVFFFLKMQQLGKMDEEREE